jgi:hypothetical protein
MGFYYRKSLSLGPFRVNLSKSGVGYSVGGAGFRTGLSARGRRYTNMSIPGTGLGYRTSARAGTGCAFVLVCAGSVIGLAAGVGRLVSWPG